MTDFTIKYYNNHKTFIEKNINLNYESINSINLLEFSTLIKSAEYRKYFMERPGVEHYKLLAYFSTMFSKSNLLDIGTNKGCSSLALAYNDSNKIHSFDLYNLLDLYSYPSNVKYYVDNIIEEKYKDLILTSPFIFLDIFHDGTFELQFHNYLKQIKYKGILLLDDIKLNNEMKNYWNNIKEEKYDVSDVGHWSGTGLVIFK